MACYHADAPLSDAPRYKYVFSINHGQPDQYELRVIIGAHALNSVHPPQSRLGFSIPLLPLQPLRL